MKEQSLFAVVAGALLWPVQVLLFLRGHAVTPVRVGAGCGGTTTVFPVTL